MNVDAVPGPCPASRTPPLTAFAAVLCNKIHTEVAIALLCCLAPQRHKPLIRHPWYLALDISPSCVALFRGQGGGDFREKLEGVDGNLRLPGGSSVKHGQTV